MVPTNFSHSALMVLSQLYSNHPLLGCCSSWLLLFLVAALLGYCSSWLLLFLVAALIGCCSSWLQLLSLVAALLGCCSPLLQSTIYIGVTL